MILFILNVSIVILFLFNGLHILPSYVMLSSLTLLFDTIALCGHLSRNESEQLIYNCLYLITIKWLYFSSSCFTCRYFYFCLVIPLSFPLF